MKKEEIPESIYRIMPLYELIQMCEEPQQLILKSPRLWEDTYEGFFYKMLLTEDGLRKAYDYIIKNHHTINPTAKGNNKIFLFNPFTTEEKTLFIILKCIIQYYLTFSICFSKDTKESDAMWRIYSFNKTSLRVEFNRKKLSNIREISFSSVNYDDRMDFLEAIEKTIISENGNLSLRTFIPFLQKRESFSHEKEIRMFYKHQLENLLFFNIEKHPEHSTEDLNELIKGLKDYFTKNLEFLPSKFLITIQKYLHKFEDEDPTFSINLDVENIKINELIKSVLVHPQAPDFYVKIIKKYCKRFDIKFLDKSLLYTFDNNIRS